MGIESFILFQSLIQCGICIVLICQYINLDIICNTIRNLLCFRCQGIQLI